MPGDKQEAPWPLPRFYFEVDIKGAVGEKLAFQEVTGLSAETQVIEYRSGNSPQFSAVKMPGIAKNGNVTLKKGIFAKDNKLFEWYAKIKMNTIERADVTIKLLDESGNAAMIWTLTNCWPSKITGADLKSDGNDVAVESVEIVHEGIKTSLG